MMKYVILLLAGLLVSSSCFAARTSSNTMTISYKADKALIGEGIQGTFYGALKKPLPLVGHLPFFMSSFTFSQEKSENFEIGPSSDILKRVHFNNLQMLRLLVDNDKYNVLYNGSCFLDTNQVSSFTGSHVTVHLHKLDDSNIAVTCKMGN